RGCALSKDVRDLRRWRRGLIAWSLSYCVCSVSSADSFGRRPRHHNTKAPTRPRFWLRPLAVECPSRVPATDPLFSANPASWMLLVSSYWGTLAIRRRGLRGLFPEAPMGEVSHSLNTTKNPASDARDCDQTVASRRTKADSERPDERASSDCSALRHS